jgi:hypothetical protein
VVTALHTELSSSSTGQFQLSWKQPNLQSLVRCHHVCFVGAKVFVWGGGGGGYRFFLRRSYGANTPPRRFCADADLAYLVHLAREPPSPETCYSTPACRRRLRLRTALFVLISPLPGGYPRVFLHWDLAKSICLKSRISALCV